MSDYASLGKLSELLPDIPGAQPFLDGIDDLDLSVLEQVHIQDFVVSEDNLGSPIIQIAAAIAGETTLPLPVLNFISLQLGANIPGFTFLRAYLLLGQDGYLQLYDFRLALRIEQPFLRLYDLETDQILADEFRFEVDAALTIDRMLDLQFELYNFNIPPFTIGSTGLILGLEGCQIDMGGQSGSAAISTSDGVGEFVGIYANSAILYWLPQFQVPFAPFKGVRLEFEDVALEKAGISFDFDLTWHVAHDNSRFLPETEFMGTLLGDRFGVALANAKGRVSENIPHALALNGFIQMPFPNAILAVAFTLDADFETGNFTTEITLTKASDADILIPLGGAGYQIAINSLLLNGELSDDGFNIEGLAGFAINLPGFVIDVEETRMSFAHSEAEDSFAFALENVQFGPLGTVDEATLQLKAVRTEDGGTELSELFMEVALSWEDIENRLSLDELPEMFPLPPDDAEISALLQWQSDKLTLKFAADVTDVDNLWRFIPDAGRPEIRRAQFAFSAIYDTANDFHNSDAAPDSAITGSDTADDSSVQIAVELSMRLPSLPEIPGVDLFEIGTGDEEGWIEARLQAKMEDGGDAALGLTIENPVTVDVNLPGIPQPQPPIHTAVTAVSLIASTDGDQIDGSLEIGGEFALRPILPPEDFFPIPILPHLEALLNETGLDTLSGTSSFLLEFKGDKAALTLTCDFGDGAGVEIDLFDMVSNLAQGVAGPSSENESSIDLDIDFGFALRGVSLKLGSIAEDAANAEQFSLAFVIAFSFMSETVEVTFTLSDQQFSLGLSELPIPLSIPHFPISADDLQAFRIDPSDPNSLWDYRIWVNDKRPLLQSDINELEQLDEPTQADRKALINAHGKKFLIDAIFAIRRQLSAPANEQLYQTYIEFMIGLLEKTTGALHVETAGNFVLSNIKFLIPFQDPRNISVQGGAKLAGFAADDPLKGLEDIDFIMGLSSEYIYFSVEGGGNPIDLPDFGRYPGGQVNLKEFRIGYGYTKNSFSLALAGELDLPPQLIEDADTSAEIGIGVRLPYENRLGFKLDLIPIVLGAVEFVMPLLEFDVDLRRGNSPGLVGTETCEPYWDGLQLIIPGVWRNSIKHVAFSPAFAGMPILNARFDGDLVIGNDETGLTVILDNMLYLGFFSFQYPIPFFADGQSPFFENLCVNVRVGGFYINFNLQRPFPSLSPLALFEVLGLLADPMMPIDSNGALANTIRVSLQDARIVIPPLILQMFPELAQVSNKEVNININLGTFITALQSVTDVAGVIVETIQNGTEEIAHLLDEISRNPPEISIGKLLTAVPPELRIFRTSGSFVGFTANAVLVLISPEDALTMMEHRDNPEQDAPTRQEAPIHIIDGDAPVAVDMTAVTAVQPTLSETHRGDRVYDPHAAENNLFTGKAFKDFAEDDLHTLIETIDQLLPHQPTGGIIVAAQVKLILGQRYRFLGFLFSDGSFGMVTAVDIKPLRLAVAGLTVELPLAVQGRLTLAGRVKRDGGYSFVRAEGRGAWTLLPGVLSIRVGQKRAVLLALYSDGRFQVTGSASIWLFDNPRPLLACTVDISETHFMVDGRFRYVAGGTSRRPVIDLQLEVNGRVGPGPQFSFGGHGNLKILGQPLSQVSGEINQDRAYVTAHLDTGRWTIMGKRLDCQLTLDVQGEVNLRKTTQPEFSLMGNGRLELLNAVIQGSGGIRAVKGHVRAFLEGQLFWQYREWVNGRIELGSDGFVHIAGHTSFALDLTPSELPAGLQLASLYFKIDIGGSFQLEPSNAFAGCSLGVDWVLGIRFPGSAKQMFPIAMQKQKVNVNTGGTLNRDLIHFQKLNFLPLDDITVPVPEFKVTDKMVFYGYPEDPIPPFNVLLPIPEMLLDDKDDFTRLFSVPIQWSGPTFKNKSITALLNDFKFTIRLAWGNGDLGEVGELGIVIKRSSNEKFIAFQEMLPA